MYLAVRRLIGVTTLWLQARARRRRLCLSLDVRPFRLCTGSSNSHFLGDCIALIISYEAQSWMLWGGLSTHSAPP